MRRRKISTICKKRLQRNSRQRGEAKPHDANFYCGQLTEREIARGVCISEPGPFSPRPRRRAVHRFARPTGLVQIVVNPRTRRFIQAGLKSFGANIVVQITGHVRARPRRHAQSPSSDRRGGSCSPKRSPFSTRPKRRRLKFQEHNESSEDVRLKYRYLDLRRPSSCSATSVCDTTSARKFAGSSMRKVFSISKRRCSRAPRPKARATFWCRRDCLPVLSTRCRSRRSCLSRC